MAHNSRKSNNLSTILSLRSPNETLFSCSGKAVNRVGQLGLRAKEKGKGSAWVHGHKENVFSCPSLNDVQDTESIIRASQILRAKLVHAVSNKVVVVVGDTEEKKKGREMMLQAQLLRASAIFAPYKNEVVGGTSKPTSFDIMTAHIAVAPYRSPHRFLNSVDPNTCPTLLTTYYGNANVSGNEKDHYDGRTHSYPYKKNGPYTCPKCKHVSETSQKFAAHVSSSHYKYESKSERKKRVLAKVRGIRRVLLMQ